MKETSTIVYCDIADGVSKRIATKLAFIWAIWKRRKADRHVRSKSATFGHSAADNGCSSCREGLFTRKIYCLKKKRKVNSQIQVEWNAHPLEKPQGICVTGSVSEGGPMQRKLISAYEWRSAVCTFTICNSIANQVPTNTPESCVANVLNKNKTKGDYSFTRNSMVLW